MSFHLHLNIFCFPVFLSRSFLPFALYSLSVFKAKIKQIERITENDVADRKPEKEQRTRQKKSNLKV